VNKLGTFTNTFVGITSRLSKLAYPGGASANYLYFANSGDKRLQQIKNLNNNTNANKNFISEQDYTYDAEGQIKTWTKNYSGIAAVQRLDLGYDNADQLTTAPVKNNSTNALIKQYTYGYDSASNRTSETVATTTTTSTPNNVNEITSQSGGVTRTLTYDLNGSMTSDGGTRTFEWDGANRLVAINYTGFTTRSEFTYDGLSRVAKIVEKTGSTINSTRKFVWSGQEKLEFRDATDAVTQRNYAQGQYVGTTAYLYTRDHLGSIREMFTGGGTVVARYDYDPYGRSTTVLGTTPTDFNFTGLYRHSKSNLDLATYRAYDPDLGRWLSRDPIGEQGGTNLYRYVHNDSVNAIDPLGLLDFRIGEGASDHTRWLAARGLRRLGGTVVGDRILNSSGTVTLDDGKLGLAPYVDSEVDPPVLGLDPWDLLGIGPNAPIRQYPDELPPVNENCRNSIDDFLPVVIAHELGHALGLDDQQTIQLIENPLRGELHMPLRKTYHGALIR
jgi:RHS repeat-associated protein